MKVKSSRPCSHKATYRFRLSFMYSPQLKLCSPGVEPVCDCKSWNLRQPSFNLRFKLYYLYPTSYLHSEVSLFYCGAPQAAATIQPLCDQLGVTFSKEIFWIITYSLLVLYILYTFADYRYKILSLTTNTSFGLRNESRSIGPNVKCTFACPHMNFQNWPRLKKLSQWAGYW